MSTRKWGFDSASWNSSRSSCARRTTRGSIVAMRPSSRMRRERARGPADRREWRTVTLDGSAFALPENRAAKADPAAISADDERLREIDRALDAARADLERRLADARIADGGAGQDAMDRDIAVHHLAARQKVLRRFSIDLCLGRIVPADGSEALYIGRTGLVAQDGRRLLVDWRAPAAEPFFAATHAN